MAWLEFGQGSPEIKRFCEMTVAENRKGVGFKQKGCRLSPTPPCSGQGYRTRKPAEAGSIVRLDLNSTSDLRRHLVPADSSSPKRLKACTGIADNPLLTGEPGRWLRSAPHLAQTGCLTAGPREPQAAPWDCAQTAVTKTVCFGWRSETGLCRAVEMSSPQDFAAVESPLLTIVTCGESHLFRLKVAEMRAL